jgi:hypothetical protein
MTARRILIALIILSLLFAIAACKIDGDGWGTPTPDTSAGGAIAATATYGAEQFHLQLTALAETEEP